MTNKTIKPCPLCASTDISKNKWSLEQGEVDAYECNNCYCGAPVQAWNERPPSRIVLSGFEISNLKEICIPDEEFGQLSGEYAVERQDGIAVVTDLGCNESAYLYSKKRGSDNGNRSKT